MSKRKVIITCAVNGNAPFNSNFPNFPVTPPQIAAACVEAAEAGASIVHVHARDSGTQLGVRDAGVFKEIVDRIRQTGVDIVLNLTCGHGGFFLPDPDNEGRALPESDIAGVEERIEHLVDCLPDIASLDVSTGNQEEGDVSFVYLNTTRTLRGMAKRFQELGVKPELEAFQPGDVLFANQLIEEGLVDGPPLYQFVLGVKWAAPATPETAIYMRGLLPKRDDLVWTAMGIARDEFPMAAQSIILGGHVRVGLEDNLYLERGVFATNGKLVERAVRIIEALGCQAASPDEARALLGLRGLS